MTLYHDVAGVPTEEKIPILKNPDDKGLFYHKVRSFLDAVLNDLPAPVPTSQILYNQAIIDGICRSAECGHELAIEIPEIYFAFPAAHGLMPVGGFLVNGGACT